MNDGQRADAADVSRHRPSWAGSGVGVLSPAFVLAGRAAPSSRIVRRSLRTGIFSWPPSGHLRPRVLLPCWAAPYIGPPPPFVWANCSWPCPTGRCEPRLVANGHLAPPPLPPPSPRPPKPYTPKNGNGRSASSGC